MNRNSDHSSCYDSASYSISCVDVSEPTMINDEDYSINSDSKSGRSKKKK